MVVPTFRRKHTFAAPGLGREHRARAASDAVLQSRIARLLDMAALGLSKRVLCDVRNGAAVLTGAVSSYYMKQLAQAAVQQAGGLTRVNNALRVTYGLQ